MKMRDNGFIFFFIDAGKERVRCLRACLIGMGSPLFASGVEPTPTQHDTTETHMPMLLWRRDDSTCEAQSPSSRLPKAALPSPSLLFHSISSLLFKKGRRERPERNARATGHFSSLPSPPLLFGKFETHVDFVLCAHVKTPKSPFPAFDFLRSSKPGSRRAVCSYQPSLQRAERRRARTKNAI